MGSYPAGARYALAEMIVEGAIPRAEIVHEADLHDGKFTRAEALRGGGAPGRSGSEFGAAGEGHLRLSYSVDGATIAKGMAIATEVFSHLD